MSIFDDLVREQLRRNRAVEEKLCEDAIKTGRCGAILISLPNGTVRGGISPLVPYGELYQFPSEDAYNKWLDRISE